MLTCTLQRRMALQSRRTLGAVSDCWEYGSFRVLMSCVGAIVHLDCIYGHRHLSRRERRWRYAALSD